MAARAGGRCGYAMGSAGGDAEVPRERVPPGVLVRERLLLAPLSRGDDERALLEGDAALGRCPGAQAALREVGLRRRLVVVAHAGEVRERVRGEGDGVLRFPARG